MGARLTQPQGLPTATAASEERAWSTLVNLQLVNARKSAENWRNGLVAISGLIAAVSVVKGPDQIGGLDAPFAYAVGALLLLALAAAVTGAWNALHAAYGTPATVTRHQVRAQGGVTGYRLHLAQISASRLTVAKGATVATLVCLVIAVGLTWYGPRSSAVSLEVSRAGLPAVCGTLVASREGYIELRPDTGQAVRLMLSELDSMRSVRKCQ